MISPQKKLEIVLSPSLTILEGGRGEGAKIQALSQGWKVPEMGLSTQSPGVLQYTPQSLQMISVWSKHHPFLGTL